MTSILVTGGTGTFGRAFIQYLLEQTKIDRICVYSRGEHAQAAIGETFNHDPRLRMLIGDVRDVDRLTRACRGIDTIVHAAALKRIETGAYNPDEMVKTNVLGTMNVIEAAITNNVKNVVSLSSDKAYQPISPYGQSKALGESLILAANSMHGQRGPKFAAVRYGNIWKAQGSVVPKWLAAIHNGADSINVTDTRCTRFFMTVEEAVHLVWDSIGEKALVIPETLPAYRLYDLAQAMTMEYGVSLNVIGLPHYEKLHESMHDGLCSMDARRMTINELRAALIEEGEGGGSRARTRCSSPCAPALKS